VSRAALVSALLYTSASLAAAGLFLAVTFLKDGYGWVDRGGGAGWVFLLAMIILMPTVTPWVKRKAG
jgi:hypothetical protein